MLCRNQEALLNYRRYKREVASGNTMLLSVCQTEHKTITHYWQYDSVVKVFPDLRAWCEARRLHLVDVDLRWV